LGAHADIFFAGSQADICEIVEFRIFALLPVSHHLFSELDALLLAVVSLGKNARNHGYIFPFGC